jgi:hypothetical protein
MRFLRFQNAVLALSLLAFAGYCVVLPAPATAQSNTSGDIAGTVSDASGAVVPNAKVTVTSSATGEAKAEVSDKSGTFRVPLLAPGRYKISIGAAGFETSTSEVTVSAGVVTPVSIKLSVGSAATTVEVTGGALQVLHTEDAQISTSFSAEEIAALPNPGGDLTFVAQTTPGAVMNTQGGYGNFSVDGLPGTSNTFTVNGGYEGDPYLNLNNSGATNLLQQLRLRFRRAGRRAGQRDQQGRHEQVAWQPGLLVEWTPPERQRLLQQAVWFTSRV